jgi:hypothetical protein
MTQPQRFKILDKKVVICPSKSEENSENDGGVNFLRENNAWGYVKIAQDPIYFALYEGDPTMAIRYFGIIDQIISPIDTHSPFRREPYAEKLAREGKKLILLKEGTLEELEHPIRIGPSRIGIMGTQFVDLSTFLDASTLDDFRKR